MQLGVDTEVSARVATGSIPATYPTNTTKSDTGPQILLRKA